MKILQLPRCVFGLHQRDRRHAWYDGPVVRSYCCGCGKPMVKDSRGWHLVLPEIEKSSVVSE